MIFALYCVVLALPHLEPGKEQKACPKKEAAGEALTRCGRHLAATAEEEGERVPCGHTHTKKKSDFNKHINISLIFMQSTRGVIVPVKE